MLDDGSLAIDDLITHRFPLAQADVAVAALQNRVEPIWMAVVNP
jgi:threonine dehydrogenase-like Zn-dependent dehydrogenase